jgi:hypothetical protein
MGILHISGSMILTSHLNGLTVFCGFSTWCEQRGRPGECTPLTADVPTLALPWPTPGQANACHHRLIMAHHCHSPASTSASSSTPPSGASPPASARAQPRERPPCMTDAPTVLANVEAPAGQRISNTDLPSPATGRADAGCHRPVIARHRYLFAIRPEVTTQVRHWCGSGQVFLPRHCFRLSTEVAYRCTKKARRSEQFGKRSTHRSIS